MKTSNSIAFSVILSVVLSGTSCIDLVDDDDNLLEKVHEDDGDKESLGAVLTNNGPSVKSHRQRQEEFLRGDQYKELKGALQELSKAVRGIQGEYEFLDNILSKQGIAVDRMDQELIAVRNVITNIEGNFLIVTGTLGRLITEVDAVENYTKKLESAVSNTNVLLHLVLEKGRDQTEQINRLNLVTSQLMTAVSQESLNKTIQNMVPAAVMSSTDDLRKQVSELKSELEGNRTMNAMDDAQAALQQISELREKCVSKDELDQWKKNVSEVSTDTGSVNKCTVNVRHEPRDGRTLMRLVMHPPKAESTNCN